MGVKNEIGFGDGRWEEMAQGQFKGGLKF